LASHPARTPLCPICNRPLDPTVRGAAPFCSPRCRIIDLGNWLGGTYAVPAAPADDDDLAVPRSDDG
jgi:endogenous inhibitor of DNA gyrase (YacG/DUF329 family)